MLVYTVVIAIVLTIFFDLSRIASLGAILYLIMDVIIQWGVFKHLRKEIKANGAILLTTIVLDFVVLSAFLWNKGNTDLFLIAVAVIFLLLVFFYEKWLLKTNSNNREN
jgi:hypothetical protein